MRSGARADVTSCLAWVTGNDGRVSCYWKVTACVTVTVSRYRKVTTCDNRVHSSVHAHTGTNRFEVNGKHNLQTEKFYEQSVMRDVLQLDKRLGYFVPLIPEG